MRFKTRVFLALNCIILEVLKRNLFLSYFTLKKFKKMYSGTPITGRPIIEASINTSRFPVILMTGCLDVRPKVWPDIRECSITGHRLSG